MIQRLISYLTKTRRTKYVPLQYINRYERGAGSRDEWLLMESGHARSPGEARRLLTRYNAKSAGELIPLLPSMAPRPHVLARLRWLVLAIEGNYRGSAFTKRPRRNNDQIPIRYTFRSRK